MTISMRTSSLLLCAVVLLISSPVSFARIGESLEECKARYGSLNPMSDKIGARAVQRDFRNKMMLTSVTFLDGKAACIDFRKNVQSLRDSHFESREIDELLENNSAGLKWMLQWRDVTEARPYITKFGDTWTLNWQGPYYGSEKWLLEDGSVSARYYKSSSSDTKSSLKIQTPEFEEYYLDAVGMGKKKDKFEGF
jgi:hypothetical protein